MKATDFLLARIEEEEQRVAEALAPDCSGSKTFYGTHGGSRDDWDIWVYAVPTDHILALCRAKREVVKFAEMWDGDANDYGQAMGAVEILAGAYSDHPDYQQEWAS